MNTKDLLAVTKRASLVRRRPRRLGEYTLRSGELQVTAASQNQEFSEELPIEYKGDEFQVAFNPQFVMDALKHVDTEKVTLGMTTPVNPTLVEPVGGGEYRFVVMPMRL